ncbi:Ribose ABC transport system, ATP-binding protein RbsA (TC 3.A.1.2.1) [Halanaerobium saccharolyticum subsp. saccharolyticum DSM 6643]|uniref:Ribose ABC transport system, ATP-binding protein RbsA (TC 3.A.1.2.1) n=1 Tax=Halanaerobium saccharolyticum subsp. saccharolyticum DSM 6643 TaxID=1293054 RepID=M5DYL5_9FIRM|nr:L-arabinose ABC transporter ATP-binding protein AraG [Halanaerobium saccharolyticum]CCU78248.1 Ribose ABC transport system, ATP-binding protein RbsA (TC 3.A.1.2.1) [Halanaerobium saccharolyticum subsp. saccharolyticum DSM 6643]
MAYHLEFKNITKTFPGVKALDKISFGVNTGSIHGLVGENGAGKSTLLHTLSGALTPNQGEILIENKTMKFSNTKDALNAGIAVIYQELNLVPEMTVAENLMIGNYPNKNGFVDKKKLKEKALKQIKMLMENFNPKTKVKDLSIAQKQMIEIGKALMQDAKIIAFDEPTSSLSDREIKHLFEIIEKLKEDGKAIIYVSHRMEEIFQICDSCTVFRDGKHIETFRDMEKVTHDLIVKKMVGRELNDIYGYEERDKGEEIFHIENIRGKGVKRNIDLTVHEGEVVGIFGLVGAGRTELFKLIYGLEKIEAGRVEVRGEEVSLENPKESIRNKVCLLPEDRKDEGIIGIRSVSENINISSRRHHLRYNFFLNKQAEKETTDEFIENLDIKTPSRDQLAVNLSGGNQQKVILSRWLSEDIDVFLMDEPTRGIDVGAKYEIYKIMYNLAADGKGILFVSSDLPEVMGVSDRVVVMRSGEIIGSLNREEFTEEKILSMALPVS